jgi:hypothetical protein
MLIDGLVKHANVCFILNMPMFQPVIVDVLKSFCWGSGMVGSDYQRMRLERMTPTSWNSCVTGESIQTDAKKMNGEVRAL